MKLTVDPVRLRRCKNETTLDGILSEIGPSNTYFIINTVQYAGGSNRFDIPHAGPSLRRTPRSHYIFRLATSSPRSWGSITCSAESPVDDSTGTWKGPWGQSPVGMVVGYPSRYDKTAFEGLAFDNQKLARASFLARAMEH